MDWQLAIVWLAVALAAAYLLRSAWRTWSARKGSCGGCGCGGKSTSTVGTNGKAPFIPADQITLRRRDRQI